MWDAGAVRIIAYGLSIAPKALVQLTWPWFVVYVPVENLYFLRFPPRLSRELFFTESALSSYYKLRGIDFWHLQSSLAANFFCGDVMFFPHVLSFCPFWKQADALTGVVLIIPSRFINHIAELQIIKKGVSRNSTKPWMIGEVIQIKPHQTEKVAIRTGRFQRWQKTMLQWIQKKNAILPRATQGEFFTQPSH